MIVFSDLDGTFFDSHKRITPINRQALDELAARGIEFVPCSGRPLMGIVPEILQHPAVHYAVSANGALVSDLASGEALHRVDLGLERALWFFGLAQGHDVVFDFFADGHDYMLREQIERLPEFVSDPYVLGSMRSTRTPFEGDPVEFARSLGHIERVGVYWRDPADRDAIEEAVRCDQSVAVVRSYANNIEVSDRDATKGAALTWLCGHLGIPREDALGFGDNINDISMIKAAGTGVAVANAEPEVRAAADVVAMSNDDAGVGRFVLDRLGVSL